MRNLFNRDEDGRIVIEPQTWLLEPYANVRKKYKENDIADAEMAVIWFAVDYRSDFLQGGDLKKRIDTIKTKMFGHRNLKIDDVTYEAAKFYMEEQDTPKIKLIRALRSGLERATQTINDSGMDTLEDIKTFSDIVNKLPGMIESIDKVEALVKKDINMESKIVGSGEKGMYEDG